MTATVASIVTLNLDGSGGPWMLNHVRHDGGGRKAPSRKRKPFAPHPLFTSFVEAAVSLPLWLGLVLIAAPAAAQQGGTHRDIEVAARFIDVTAGRATMDDTPELARRPTLAEVAAHAPAIARHDFGASFNCAIEQDGALGDCRPLYAIPDEVNAAKVAQVVSPLIRVTPGTAKLAHDNAYRVTIDLAVQTRDSAGRPQVCRPPFCFAEGATPPLPPPVPHDPVVRVALSRAEQCFSSRWADTTPMRFAAERAVRADAGKPSPATRAAVLAYVRGRQRLMGCITGLERDTRTLPLDAKDRGLVKSQVDAMRSSYFCQTKYEMAILIGLLDGSAADAEEGFLYPN